MYPRNSASPEPIAIGPVVQISDGAVQSSGVTVRVLPFGGSEADGGGTTAYSTDGVVVYTPTQAETNYTSFVLIAKKTGCIPASVTVVTSESSVSGRVYVQTNGDKTGYTASVSDKTGFSLLANTGLGNQTANITGNLSGSVGSVTGSVGSVTSPVAVSDKTGYTLASDGLALIASWTVDITGSLSGSVGSISGVTFPSNFGLLGIDGAGIVLQVGTVDELGANALTANGAGDAIEDYVWDAQYSQHTTAGTFGKLFDIWRKSNPAIEGTIQASPSPTTTVFKTDVDYPTGAFKHSVLFFADDASIPFQNSPILTVVNNGDGTSTITIEEDTTAAPVAGDKFYIIPSNHVHAIAAIVDAVWDEATAGHTTAGTTGKALIDSGAAGNPWSTDLSSGYTGTQAGNILNSVKSQTDLIQSGGTVTVSTPVTSSGQLASPLIIGDDYLAANGRAFSWTVPLPSGFDASTATCKFGMRYEDDQGVNNFIATGTVTDAGGGNVTLAFDVARTVTGLLRPGWYDWSVEIVSASGTEITRVKSGKNAEWQEKQT